MFNHEAFLAGIGKVAALRRIHRAVFEHRIRQRFFLRGSFAQRGGFGAGGAQGGVVAARGFDEEVERLARGNLVQFGANRKSQEHEQEQAFHD